MTIIQGWSTEKHGVAGFLARDLPSQPIWNKSTNYFNDLKLIWNKGPNPLSQNICVSAERSFPEISVLSREEKNQSGTHALNQSARSHEPTQTIDIHVAHAHATLTTHTAQMTHVVWFHGPHPPRAGAASSHSSCPQHRGPREWLLCVTCTCTHMQSLIQYGLGDHQQLNIFSLRMYVSVWSGICFFGRRRGGNIRRGMSATASLGKAHALGTAFCFLWVLILLSAGTCFIHVSMCFTCV